MYLLQVLPVKMSGLVNSYTSYDHTTAGLD